MTMVGWIRILSFWEVHREPFFDNEKWIWGIRFPLCFVYRSVAQNALLVKR